MRLSSPLALACGQRCLILAAALLAAGLGSGCGYSLRGFDGGHGGHGIDRIDIEAIRVLGPDAIRREVIEAFERAGTMAENAPANRAGDLQVIHLQIIEERCRRENLIIDVGSGKERDFAIVCRLRFRLTGAGGEEIVSGQNLELRRESRHDPQRLLATEHEESMLRSDIRQDAAAEIVRRARAAWAKKERTGR